MSVPIVTIFGGSGFIGRYVAQRMARAGWRVRVAVRRPNEANFVRPYGVVGQVEPIQANIRDEASTRAAIAGAAAVVNCVGIMTEAGKQTFEAIVEAFSTMREDLDKEKKAITKQWAKREEQIERVMQATVGMYGDLQGIAGKSLKEIEGLELTALNPPTSEME